MNYPSKLWKLITFIVLTWTLTITVLRAIRGPNNYSKAYWLLDYRFGFIRRGLIGTLCWLLTSVNGSPMTEESIRRLAAIAFCAFLVVLLLMVWRILYLHNWNSSSVLLAITFISSPFIVMNSHLVGYLDNLLYILTISSVFLVLSGHLFVAALMQAVAILIHESYIIIGYPAVCLMCFLIREKNNRGLPIARVLLWQVTPLMVFCFICVYQSFFIDTATLRVQLSTYLESFDFIPTHRDIVVLIQTAGFFELFQLQRADLLERFLNPVLFASIGPSLLSIIYMIHGCFRVHPLYPLSWAVLGICLSPLAMHIIAWDAARIWTYTIGSAILTLWVFSETQKTSGRLRFFASLALPAILLNILMHIPLMDGRYERFSIISRLLLYSPTLVLAVLTALKFNPMGGNSHVRE